MIVGTAPRVALAVARSLAGRGITVIAVPSSDDEGRILSSAIARYVPLPDSRERSPEFDAGLATAVRDSGADMLVACSDRALAAIARNYADLKAMADPGCPLPDVVARVLDKTATVAAANAVGIEVPATFDLTIAASIGALPFPLIAKPKSHTGLGGYRIRYFRESTSLEEAMQDDPDFAARYLLQEFVPGYGVGIGVLMRDGAAVAAFAHRRLKELPAAGGVSVVSESMTPEPALVDASVRLLQAIGWQGIALVEFRRAPDGTARLMEINGRYWGSLPTALAAGVDFPYYQWQIAHGLSPDVPASYPIGVRVRWTRGAILRLRERLFEKPGFGTASASRADEWRSFWNDFASPVRSAMWSARDPIPAFVDIWPGVSRFVRSALRAVVKAALPAKLVRAYRRFGARSAAEYAWSALLRAIGIRRKRLPRPFAPGRVLFVCAGNIMRSAFAEALFLATLRAAGIENVVVESCGLHASPGAAADPRAVVAARDAGLDLSSHRARSMDESLADSADAIFVMERMQELDVARRFPANVSKTYLLGACMPGRPDVDIVDPYLSSDDECKRVLALVGERTSDIARVVVRDVSPRGPGAGEAARKDATPPGAE
jgi:protein-tyrosine-phosphatase/predicted ATP-grasp superfamily ATP-dependent carboligase